MVFTRSLLNLLFLQLYIPEGEEPMTEADIEAIRLRNLKSSFKTQDKVKIGCCNGLPYNSSKRCCCRRIPFDKEHKFCCAINVSPHFIYVLTYNHI